ncbi:helix-turn-helix domain-containing protein [Streptomyces sp. NPDC005017]|uniref:helix-turn-helix domain-containing protein n=1 Tax=Streptomyces sp. NPDC005017 TaxID=3364706 RepID=UPI0036CB08E8
MIAKDLRVSVRSVQRWRQIWDEDGPQPLRSQGPMPLPRLSGNRFAQLGAELVPGGLPRMAGKPAVLREGCAGRFLEGGEVGSAVGADAGIAAGPRSLAGVLR